MPPPSDKKLNFIKETPDRTKVKSKLRIIIYGDK